MSLEIFADAAVWRRSARDDAAAVRSGDAAVMRQPCGRYAAVMRQRCGTMRHFLLARARWW